MHSVPFSFYALESRREQTRLALWASTEASNTLQGDHARKALFCRHPRKCIAEKRNVAKFTSMAGAVWTHFVLGSEGKRAVAAISAAHSSTPCCTSAQETPFGVILGDSWSEYWGKILHCSRRFWLPVSAMWRVSLRRLDNPWAASAGNNTLLPLPRG